MGLKEAFLADVVATIVAHLGVEEVVLGLPVKDSSSVQLLRVPGITVGEHLKYDGDVRIALLQYKRIAQVVKRKSSYEGATSST